MTEMARTRFATTIVHRLIRGIVLLNLALGVLDSNAIPRSQDFILHNQLVASLFYWIVASTLLAIGLLLAQGVQRVYTKAKAHEGDFAIVDKGFLVDLSFVAVWLFALLVGALRSAAGASG